MIARRAQTCATSGISQRRLRKAFLTNANTNSHGFNSGEYVGRNLIVIPAALNRSMMIPSTSAWLCTGALSMKKISPRFRYPVSMSEHITTKNNEDVFLPDVIAAQQGLSSSLIDVTSVSVYRRLPSMRSSRTMWTRFHCGPRAFRLVRDLLTKWLSSRNFIPDGSNDKTLHRWLT